MTPRPGQPGLWGSLRALVALATVLALLTRPGVAQGQDVEVPSPPAIPEGEDVIDHVLRGAAAPYEGYILDVDTSIRWTLQREWWPAELERTLRAHALEIRILTESHERELTLTTESYEREITGLREDIRRQAEVLARPAPTQPWYDTFGFGLVIGLVISAVLVGLVAWAAAEL